VNKKQEKCIWHKAKTSKCYQNGKLSVAVPGYIFQLFSLRRNCNEHRNLKLAGAIIGRGQGWIEED
jgi:hypothetical protein